MASRKQKEKAKHRTGLIKRLQKDNSWRPSRRAQQKQDKVRETMQNLALQMGLGKLF